MQPHMKSSAKLLLAASFNLNPAACAIFSGATSLAGYSLGDADLLRRAMGKKKPEEMAKQRERFIQGALERGFPQKKVEKIFDLMEQFAGYGFNKSHSAAYAYL